MPKQKTSMRATIDVYLARLKATIYADDYIPRAIRLAELSQAPIARNYPALPLTDEQLQLISVEPHMMSIIGRQETNMVKMPDGEEREVVDNATIWMIFKIPSEFNLSLREVEEIVGLLKFGFGKYGTCKIEEFYHIGKNYAEET
jgi:hypothetical protein